MERHSFPVKGGTRSTGEVGPSSNETHSGLDMARLSVAKKQQRKQINPRGVLIGSSRLSLFTVWKKWPNIPLVSAGVKRERERECSDRVVTTRNVERLGEKRRRTWGSSHTFHGY